MQRPRPLVLLLIVAALAPPPTPTPPCGRRTLTLTGIVTTNDVIVSPQVAGQLRELLVKEGDVVKKDQRIATIVPDELAADTAYYAQNAAGLPVAGARVRGRASLRAQPDEQSDRAGRVDAGRDRGPGAGGSRRGGGGGRDLRPHCRTWLGSRSPPARTSTRRGPRPTPRSAKLEALRKQVEAQRATVAMARSGAEQVDVRRSQVQATQHQEAAAAAQRTKADVRLAYAEIHAPIDGFVDVRAARPGEYVSPGQPIVTLVDPDDFWVRADVEETYIDRVRIGDTPARCASPPGPSGRAPSSTAASTRPSPPSAT